MFIFLIFCFAPETCMKGTGCMSSDTIRLEESMPSREEHRQALCGKTSCTV